MNKLSIPSLAGLIRPRDIVVEDKFDKILKAHLDNKISELPSDLQLMLSRWKLIYNMLSDGKLVKEGKHKFYMPYKYNDLINFLMTEFDISIRTAREDIKSAKRFYAVSETKEENDFAKGLFLEQCEQRSARAWGIGDGKTAAAYDKIITSIRQWDKPADPELPKYAELQIPHTVIIADPTELGFEPIENVDDVVKKVLAKRKKNKIDSIFAEADAVELMNVKDDANNSETLAE
ncbi:hypothetical protein D3C87_664280 [compost metagenome]